MKYAVLMKSFATPACACSGSGQQGRARGCPGHDSGNHFPRPYMGQIQTPSCAKLLQSSTTGKSTLTFDLLCVKLTAVWLCHFDADAAYLQISQLVWDRALGVSGWSDAVC